MKLHRDWIALGWVVCGSLLFSLAAVSQEPELRTEVLTFRAQDGGQTLAAYYYPAGKRPKVGVVIMHPRGQNLTHFALKPLARRGLGALGMAPREINHSNVHEQLLLDVAEGVKFLKSRGVERVILIGHSGGGPLMTFYQAQAETAPPNRVKQTPAGDPPDLNKYDLPKADGLVTLNSHEAEGLHMAHRLDPSLTDENDPFSYDPSLDLYNPDNGFRLPPDPSHYSPEFVERVRKAQQERARRLVEMARGYIREQNYYQELRKSPAFQAMSLQEQLMIARRASFERTMNVYRTYAEPRYYDLSLDPSDRTLGHYTAPKVNGYKRSDLYNWSSADRMQAVSPRAFLSTESIVTNARLWDNLRKVSVPLLVVNASADSGIHPSEGQKTFEVAASKDKERVWIVGGEHSLQPEGPKAGKGDQREQFYDAVMNWIGKRWPVQ